ncbi:MAG: ATP-binding protein, partial [Chloroflexota bacterium]
KNDVADIEVTFGPGVLRSTFIIFTRNYGNLLEAEIDISEKAFIHHITGSRQLPLSSSNVSTVKELRQKLKEIPNPSLIVNQLLQNLENFNLHQEIKQRLESRLPKFLYFDEFSSLPSRFSVQHVLETPIEELEKEEVVARALLNSANITSGNFTQADSESRRVLLEASSRTITDEVFKYWSQNSNLRVDFSIEFHEQPEDKGPPPYIDVRIWNENHRVSLKFSERSKGFVWFFSFMVTFNDLLKNDNKMILLLDEPGLGLHAQAQHDLMKFFDEKVSINHQVVFSTHSPFMIDPGKLTRLRGIEDDGVNGTKVKENLVDCIPETLMPVRAALGKKISESLSFNSGNLLVERLSDILYLKVFSQHLQSQGRIGLDEDWTLFPIGNVENIPSFTALVDVEGKPAILANVRESQKHTLLSFAQQNILESDKLFLITDFTGGKEGDLEDLMGEKFYLSLLRDSGLADINQADLPPGSRIIDRIEQHRGMSLDLFKPALHLLGKQNRLLAQINGSTLNRFEELFKKINVLSKKNAHNLQPTPKL